jgi:hypothetical protein
MAGQSINKKHEYSTSDFDGVNTQALRQAIKPGQQAWLENIQPIGPANAKVVPSISSQLAQLTGGVTPYYAQGFNIIIGGTATDLIFVASTDGNIWSINLSTYVVTAITLGTANAGKFTKCSAAQWKNERLMIVDSSTGVWDWDGTTLTNTAAAIKGTCIATFSNVVWVANNRTINYTAQNSYSDFSTAAGHGGSIILSDETLHSSIQQLISSNNFLYVFGIDSVNVFSDVRLNTSGNPIFTNTNLSTGVGTGFPMSCTTYGRSVWFASANGFYGLYGASARKESTELDGMYDQILNINNPSAVGAAPTVSAGLVTINQILCVAFLFTYEDVGLNRPLLAIYFDKKWFFASQGANSGESAPTMIVDCPVKGKNRLYSFDTAGRFYEMFSGTSDVTYMWKTALWDFQQPIQYKQATKVGVGANFAGSASTITGTVDSEASSVPISPGLSVSGTLTFVGTGPITFTSTGPPSLPITFLTSGYSLLQSDATNWGRYVGVTLTGTASELTFTLMMMEYNYRSQWGN